MPGCAGEEGAGEWGWNSQGTGDGVEYTLHRTVLCVIWPWYVRGYFPLGRERVDGSQGAGELVGAEGIEGTICEGDECMSPI